MRIGEAVCEAQLQAWEQKAAEVLRGSLQEIIAMQEAWDADGSGEFVVVISKRMSPLTGWNTIHVLDIDCSYRVIYCSVCELIASTNSLI